jgi:membrane protein
MHHNGMVGGAILASGIATRAMFALLPGLLLLVSLLGFIVKDPAVQEQIVQRLGELLPPIEDLILRSLAVISQGALPFTIIGLVTLLWAASGFFQSLDVAFAVVLGIQRRRDPVTRGAIGLVAVFVVLAAVGVTVVVGLAVSALAPDVVARLLDPAVARLVAPLVLALVSVAAVALAYRFIPNIRPTWRQVALPAIAVGVAFMVLTEIVAVIAPNLAGVASLYGAIAAVFVLLAWLQLGAQFLVMGMAWVDVRMNGLPPLDELPWPTGSKGHPAAPRTDGAEPASRGDGLAGPEGESGADTSSSEPGDPPDR